MTEPLSPDWKGIRTFKGVTRGKTKSGRGEKLTESTATAFGQRIEVGDVETRLNSSTKKHF